MSSNLDTVVDTWEVLKHHLPSVYITDAAEELVGMLVDVHGIDPQEITEAFRDHPPIRKAAKAYITVDDVDDYERDYDDFYDDED
jgi:hypothetical protein